MIRVGCWSFVMLLLSVMPAAGSAGISVCNSELQSYSTGTGETVNIGACSKCSDSQAGVEWRVDAPWNIFQIRMTYTCTNELQGYVNRSNNDPCFITKESNRDLEYLKVDIWVSTESNVTGWFMAGHEFTSGTRCAFDIEFLNWNGLPFLNLQPQCDIKDFNSCSEDPDSCHLPGNHTVRVEDGTCLHQCTEGYVEDSQFLEDVGIQTCKDRNECEEASDLCDSRNNSVCRNIPGRYECDCVEGKVLVDDECEDVTEVSTTTLMNSSEPTDNPLQQQTDFTTAAATASTTKAQQQTDSPATNETDDDLPTTAIDVTSTNRPVVTVVKFWNKMDKVVATFVTVGGVAIVMFAIATAACAVSLHKRSTKNALHKLKITGLTNDVFNPDFVPKIDISSSTKRFTQFDALSLESRFIERLQDWTDTSDNTVTVTLQTSGFGLDVCDYDSEELTPEQSDVAAQSLDDRHRCGESTEETNSTTSEVIVQSTGPVDTGSVEEEESEIKIENGEMGQTDENSSDEVDRQIEGNGFNNTIRRVPQEHIFVEVDPKGEFEEKEEGYCDSHTYTQSYIPHEVDQGNVDASTHLEDLDLDTLDIQSLDTAYLNEDKEGGEGTMAVEQKMKLPFQEREKEQDKESTANPRSVKFAMSSTNPLSTIPSPSAMGSDIISFTQSTIPISSCEENFPAALPQISRQPPLKTHVVGCDVSGGSQLAINLDMEPILDIDNGVRTSRPKESLIFNQYAATVDDGYVTYQ